MKTIIVNCGEYKNLLLSINYLATDGLIDIKKIIDYEEYKYEYHEFNVPFVSFYEHIRLRCDEIFLNRYKNISSDAIIFSHKYLKTALDILQTRHVKPGVQFTFTESIQLFYGSLNRSISEIKDNHIQLIIFNHVPHHFNTYILYVAAKYCGIKTLIVTKLSWNGFRYFLDVDIGERGWSIKNGIKSTDLSLLEDEKLFFEIKNRSSYTTPVYMVKKFNRPLVSFLSKFLGNSLFFHIGIALYGGFEIGFLKRKPMHFKWSSISKYHIEKYPLKITQVISQINSKFNILYISKIYNKLAVDVLAVKRDVDYVLFAPNYQPEATTMPSALDFSDTLLCLKLLREKIPKEVYIFYKEHEDIFNINLESDRSRSEDFYKQILKIDNLLVVSRDCNQIDLIDNSQCVVIQTSNIGLDALIRGKQVIAFGSTWFDDQPGIVSWKIFEQGYNYTYLLKQNNSINHDFLKNINKFTVRLDEIDNSNEAVESMRKIFIKALAI